MNREDKDRDDEGMDLRDDEALWRLLGRHDAGQVGPYFSRRVLREVKLAGESRASGWLRLWPTTPRYAALWSGVAALALVCAAEMWTPARPPIRPSQPETYVPPAVVAHTAAVDALTALLPPEDASATDDVEVIADLDNILEREESRLWTEETARF